MGSDRPSEFLLESEVRPDTITYLAKKEAQEGYFDVWNRGEMHQIYKIKTQNVKGYKIKPPLFSIGVNERMRVHVSYLGRDKPSKDRISVVYSPHANVKDTVAKAWETAKMVHNTPEKRAYVTILFKEDQRRSIAEVNEKEAQKSVISKSVTMKPQGPGSSRMDTSSSHGGSAGRENDSYYAPPPTVPLKAPKVMVRKKASGKSNCSTEPSEETNEEPNDRGPSPKTKKKNVSQTVEATEDETPAPPPPPAKPRSRRKVQAPPPPAAEEEEEAPPSPVRKPAVVRRIKSPARVVPVVAAAEPAEDEMAEAPIAPKKTRKPVQQPEEEEGEDEAPPPPPKPVPAKPRSRRKVQAARPPVEEDGAKKVASPVRKPRSSSSNPKPKSRRKVSSTIDPLESILGDSKVVYIIQGDGLQQNDDEEEESEKKTRKKSSKEGKKKSKKPKKEEEEDEE